MNASVGHSGSRLALALPTGRIARSRDTKTGPNAGEPVGGMAGHGVSAAPC